MPAELSGVICGGIVLLPHVYVTCMCMYVNLVACSEILLDHADRVFCNNDYHSHVMAIRCGRSSGVANGRRWPSASECLTVMSGARLRGWLACGGFQTLLILRILFAGQQKGHPSSWRGLPLRRGRSSWMVRVWE